MCPVDRRLPITYDYYYRFRRTLPYREEGLTVSLLGDIVCATDYYKEPHSHEDVEICVISGGRGSFRSGHAVFEVESGDVFLAPPGTEHASAADPADPYRMYYLAFSLEPGHRLYGLFRDLREHPPGVFKDSFGLAHLVGLMIYELQEADEDGSLGTEVLGVLMVLLLRYLHREAITGDRPGSEGRTSGGRQRIVDRIVRFIDANLHLKLSLDIVSDELGYSPGYLSRVFKDHTGRSLSRYWNRTKLDAARRYLLDNPEITIAEAAECFGFEDQHYFSRLYKRIFGIPPVVDRRQNNPQNR
jgi:AraC-like DNA-binding protein